MNTQYIPESKNNIKGGLKIFSKNMKTLQLKHFSVNAK